MVHPGYGNYSGTLVNALMYHLKDNPLFSSGDERPGLVHRIDKNTSGLLVIAKNELALNRLAKRLSGRMSQPGILFETSPDMMIRSNLIEITFANSESLIPKQMRLLEQAHAQPNIFLTFTQGIFETTLIASREIKDIILAIFKKEKIISQIDNISSLTVQLPKGTVDMPGAYHYLLKPVAWAGINLKEVVSTLNEFTMILEDKDIDQAFSLIKGLFSSPPSRR